MVHTAFATLRKLFSPRRAPEMIAYRDEGSSNAILLVHGFTAEPLGSWGTLPEQIAMAPELAGWDVFRPDPLWWTPG